MEHFGYAAANLRELSRSGEAAHASEATLNACRARRDALHHHSSDLRAVVQAVASRVRENKERFLGWQSLRRDSFVQAGTDNYEGARGTNRHPRDDDADVILELP